MNDDDEKFMVFKQHETSPNVYYKNGRTPLHLAARDNKADTAKSLLDAGADANALDDHKFTPLHTAVRTRSLAVCRVLLCDPATNLNASTQSNKTLYEVWYKMYFDEKDDVEYYMNNKGWTALHWAAHLGHDSEVDLLLEYGASLTAQTERKETPLHLAAAWNRPYVAKRLLEAGADTNACNDHGCTPLHVAVEAGSLAVCRVLLRDPATNLNAGTKINSETPPEWIFAEDFFLVNRINTDADERLEHTTNGRGWTALHWAAYIDYDSIVDLLLEHGANVTVQTTTGRTPLHLAAEFGRKYSAKRLLEAGADANACDDYSHTPLHRAVDCNALKVCQVLLRHRGTDPNARTLDGNTPLMFASMCNFTQYENSEQILVDLINAGADINAVGSKGRSSLHYATLKNNIDAVKLLIEYGANIEARNEKGLTPLHLAARDMCRYSNKDRAANTHQDSMYDPLGRIESPHFYLKRADIVRELLEAGADANAQDHSGRIPLHSAVQEDAFEVFQVLIHHPATDLDARRADDGKTALMILESSAYMLAAGAFEDLLKAGADINARDREEMSLLHYGTFHDDIDKVHYLLECGANVNIQNGNGETPLYLAARGGSLETCRLLLRKFADRYIPNHTGKLPSDIASELDHQQIVMLLINECVPGG